MIAIVFGHMLVHHMPPSGGCSERRGKCAAQTGRIRLSEALAGFRLLHHAIRNANFGAPKKPDRPEYDPNLSLDENIRLQLEWITGATGNP